MSDLGLGALSRDRLIARIEALEAERDTELGEHARAQVENEQLVRSLRKRIETLIGGDYRSRLRIEALEAAGKQLADAAVRLDADDITSALAAWRAAEGGGNG